MKTTITRKELLKLNACKSGYDIFVNAHGENTVKFSQALESNGWGDIWWFISEICNELSKDQLKDLRLLGCKWALSCITIFEEKYPEDKRPRLAIESSIKYANGEITEEALGSAARSAARSVVRSAARLAAESAAESAAMSARSAAWSAAWAAARSAAMSARSAAMSARSAARSAAMSARSAAESAVRKNQEQDLLNLFLKWEASV